MVLPSETPPVFDFSTNCNTKILLVLSSMEGFSDPSKIKGFRYTVKGPNTQAELQKTLTAGQWKMVKKLVGTGTGYFRIEAWDGLNRETVSEVREFTIQ